MNVEPVERVTAEEEEEDGGTVAEGVAVVPAEEV